MATESLTWASASGLQREACPSWRLLLPCMRPQPHSCTALWELRLSVSVMLAERVCAAPYKL